MSLARALLNNVRLLPFITISLSLTHTYPSQSRPSALRAAAVRFSSTARPVTLKERLAELIPAEIENVSLSLPSRLVSFLTPILGQGNSC